MTMKILCAFLLLTLVGGLVPRTAQAGIIEYEATDLADAVAGEDLWQYKYWLSGFVFNTDQGFTIYASSLYQQLSTPGAPNADWEDPPLVVQPDPVLASDGFFDDLALVNGASLADAFVLNFVWLGGPAHPGSQPYELYVLDGQGQTTVIGEGQTQPRVVVPEPAALFLLGMGLTSVAIRRGARA